MKFGCLTWKFRCCFACCGSIHIGGIDILRIHITGHVHMGPGFGMTPSLQSLLKGVMGPECMRSCRRESLQRAVGLQRAALVWSLLAQMSWPRVTLFGMPHLPSSWWKCSPYGSTRIGQTKRSIYSSGESGRLKDLSGRSKKKFGNYGWWVSENSRGPI